MRPFLLYIIFLLNVNYSYTQQYTEYEIKSAYLFNFAKFIEFPANTFSSDRDPFIIGVYGNESFLEVLQNIIKNRTINNRNVIAISISRPEDMKNCQIVFFSGISKNILINYLEWIANKPILTVGDNIEDFCQVGGIINFTSLKNKKHFEINPNAAQRSNITISSKLLILAKIVNDAEVKF
jgi:hypothetical protein